MSISHLFCLSQTLNILNLSKNQIGDAGARAIGQALETNQVRYIFSFFHFDQSSFLSISDTHHTQPLQ